MKPSILIDSIGLNSKSADDTNFVLFHCQGIQDIDAFYEYCMQKKDMIEYQTKKERFVTLSRQYKKLEKDVRLTGVKNKANEFTSNIVKKVGECRIFIKNKRDEQEFKEEERTFGFSNVPKKGGGTYFDIEELNALAALKVGTETIIELFEQDKLKDYLFDLYIDKFKAKANYNALSDGEKKVKALIGGLK